MKQNMSEKYIVALLMCFTGGAFDAYSYYMRGKTFATMQTGNMILLGYNLVNGEKIKALMYLIPIFAFFFGAFISQCLSNLIKEDKLIRFEQIVILFEIICVIPSFFIEEGNLNFLSNMFISLASGAQLNTFRKTKGLAIATTMCTGNLKSIGEAFGNFVTRYDKHYLLNMLLYFALILSFFTGAIISFCLAKVIGIYAVVVSLISLIIGLLIITFNKKDNIVK
jgi:uncharacterized membrane protein YoaK (UPF0700 family)